MGARLCSLLLAIAIPGAAAEADAIAISQTIQARHFPHSTLLDPIFDSPTSFRIVGYTRCGDSAIWTGHYLAAEAFRYKVTGSADALANARRAFLGIQYMLDVTGNNVLARCLVPENSPWAAGIKSEEAANGIYHSPSRDFWVGNTSRDQYSGALFGLGVAYDMIGDAAMRASIADVVTRMVQFLKDHAWTAVMPDGTVSTTLLNRPDQQLAFLQLARHVNPDQFSTSYDVERVLLSPTVIAPISFDTLSDSSYFKFNLDTINLYTLIRLESSSFGDIYRKAYDVLRNHTDNQGNAHFNMIDYAINGANPARDAETRQLLAQWLLRPRRDVRVDNHGKYPTCGDPDNACNPIPVPDRVSTDFVWQVSPYQLAGGGDGFIEMAGIDYILPYWMARYYGVIAADSVRLVSAASGLPGLAPGSIASVFGSNLVGTTQAAAAQPPPTSLGGVSVTVTDSAGVSRPAPIYYVSAGQINFVVPDGTAAGAALVTIHSAGAPDVATSAVVGAVAPALFTADASGTGVAAALAGARTLTPIFSCSGSGCTAVPVVLGVDTPVYLALFGTGIRNRSSLAGVTCTIGGVSVPVLYAGPQPSFAGLDQVNVLLPVTLRGIGSVDLVLAVDGQTANTVRVSVQ
jgi:uncharacterized protein (TIGR03437 family)